MVIAGSARTRATSPGSSAASSAATSLNWTRRAWRRSPGQAPALGHHLPGLLDYERRVSLAVVLRVEHQHDLPSRQLAGEADHLGVRLGGRQGELPLGQALAIGEVIGDDDRVFAGEQELVAELHLTCHGLHHRRGRVAAEGAHVRHVHVQVGVPVDVGEVAPWPCDTHTGGWS